MNPFEAIGSFIGGLFGANKKKQTPTPAPAPTVAPPTVATPATTVIHGPNPTVVQHTVQIPQVLPTPTAQPSNLGGVNPTPTPNPTSVNAARTALASGGSGAPLAPNVIAAAKANPTVVTPQDVIAQQMKAKSDYENSPIGLALNTVGQAGKTIGGGLVDTVNFGSRIPQTVSAAIDSLNLANDNLFHIDPTGDLLRAQADQKGYSDFQNALSNLDATAGVDSSMNADTNREAKQISSGNYSGGGNAAGDIFSALTKSLGLASSIPGIGAASGALRGSATEDAPVVTNGVKSLFGRADESSAPSATNGARAGDSPITSSPTTNKPQAITSPNQVQAPTPQPAPVTPPTPIVEPKPVETQPTPASTPVVQTQPSTREIPQYSSPVRNNKTVSVSGPNSAKYTTGDDNLDNIVHDSIVAHKGTAATASARADALEASGINQAQRSAIRNIAVNSADKNTGQISDEGVKQIQDVLTGKTAPKTNNVAENVATAPKVTEAPNAAETPQTAQLGQITRNAVKDGSINTPEGVDKVVADTTSAAHSAAQDAGDSLENIIKKGQQAYEDSQAAGHDLTPKEVAEEQPDFTPAQQKVYKDYAQELSTLRDRSGQSLKGGNQGEWYAPRQFLDNGQSAAYDPRLVNELKRTGARTNSNGNSLDYSATPFEHYIRRYADAGNAASQRMVNAVETDAKGAESGLKVPDDAKVQLQKDMQDITAKRDQEDQLRASGDQKGANAIHSVIEKDTRDAFNKVADSIPAGNGRNEAIKRLNEERGVYETTLAQTLTTSNLVNRAADQGTKIVEAVKRPLVQGLKKVVGGHYATIAKNSGTDAFEMNTSREATIAARQFSRGALGRQILDNARASVAQAGAGKNLLVRGIAKADASVRSAGGALLQAGDLSTSNIRDALQIGASRPEAQGLKTVADYNKYFTDYTKTPKFKADLETVEQSQNPKVGLAGGSMGEKSGGRISKFFSKEVDNFISTNADRLKPGLGQNRIVREANDLFKGNVTGYAGVTSRVLGSVRDAALPIVPLRRAAQQAASGDPAAVARATTTAAHAVTDSIALYGTAGAAAALGASGAVGFTGPQPVSGSSASAYNKDNNIPSNQWYLNLPNGKRVYFDPARPTGAPGVAADIAGSIVKGGNALTTAENVGSQIANQAGGNTLPQNIVNAKTAFSPSASPADRKYATSQLEALAAPSTGILNNIANVTDPTKRAPTNFVDDLKSNLPVLRSQVPAAKTASGDTIANSKQLSGGSSLFSVANNPDAGANGSKAGADPVDSEITRLHNAGIDVTPTTSNTNASNDNVKSLSAALLSDPIYQGADDKTKGEYLKGVLAGNTEKGIDPSLSTSDQQALLDGKLLGAKKGAWLDDNTNNANYQTATYDNAKAAGTLTDAQDDITNKSGLKYKMVAAQVDQKYGTTQQLRDDYTGVSQSEFTALLNPKSPEYDLKKAQEVYNYDQARVQAGLPAKYNLDKAQKTGAYTPAASTVKKDFAFANLPSALSGTGGTSSTGSKYAAATSLFTPIPDLKTPAAAAIPKGRTISVKSGTTV